MELKTTYKPKQDIFENTRMANLPILKHFDSESIKTTSDKFRKGELPLFNVLKFGSLIGLGYLTWVYILPPLFFAIGQALAIGGTLFVVGLGFFLLPVILKAMRRITRILHEIVIKHDPFGELDEQKGKMHDQLHTLRQSNGNIKRLGADLQNEAVEAEKLANKLEDKITSTRNKAREYKNEIEQIRKKLGDAAVNNDRYIQLDNAILTLVSDADIIQQEYTQQKSFVSKYGMKAATMKKVSNKLTRVETITSNKIRAFEASVKMLKKDHEFARKSNQATTAAKKAMGVNEVWEIEYATEVIASTIANDLAITAGNLKDIDSATSMYAMDSDELYASLDRIADDIDTGDSIVQSASKYAQNNFTPSEEDRANSNGFDNIF